MSPRTQEKFKEIRIEKRKLIMETALELFANKGYYTCSISDIAKSAGISKGLMYNYFVSKEELLNEIIIKGIDEMYKYFDVNHDGILSEEEFRYFIKMSLYSLENSRQFWKLYYSVIMQPEVEKILNSNFSSYGSQYYNMFYKFFESRGAEDPATEILFFSSMIKGASIQIVYNTDINSKLDQIKKLEKKILDYYK